MRRSTAPGPRRPRASRGANARSPPKRAARSGAIATSGAGDWREATLGRLRELIVRADPAVVESVKWRKPSNPDGVPVWSHAGIICVGNVLKNAVRLTFPNGPEFEDPTGLFNTRLDSRVVRAVDYFQDAEVNEGALIALVREAVRFNERKANDR